MDRARQVHTNRRFRFGDANEAEVLAAQHAHYEKYWRHREDSFVSPPERLLTEVRVLEYRLKSFEEKRIEERNGAGVNAANTQKGKGKAKALPAKNLTRIDDGGLVGKENTKIVFDDAGGFEAGARDETSILVDSEDEEMSEGEMTRLWKEVQDEGDSGVVLPQIQEEPKMKRRVARPPPTRIQPERSTRNGSANGFAPATQSGSRAKMSTRSQQAQNPIQLQNRTQNQSPFSIQPAAQHQLPPKPLVQHPLPPKPASKSARQTALHPMVSNTYIMCVSPQQAVRVLTCGAASLPSLMDRKQFPRTHYLDFRSHWEHANKKVKIGWGPHKGRLVDSMHEQWKEANINKPKSKYYFVPEQPTTSTASPNVGTGAGPAGGVQNGEATAKKGPSKAQAKAKAKAKAKKGKKKRSSGGA